MGHFTTLTTARFLENCSPEMAYEYLFAWRQDPPDKISLFFDLPGCEAEAENVLLQRGIPLIDLGLALYGHDPDILRILFDRGDTCLRCAVLSNRNLFFYPQEAMAPVINLQEVINRADRIEIVALAQNPFLPKIFYENLYNRKDEFEYFSISSLTDESYKWIKQAIDYNERHKDGKP